MVVTREDIESVKRSHDIVEVIESRGIKLKKQGVNWIGLCPFHEEKRPSFTVSQRTQTWKCFGCGEGGDVIGFISKYDKLTFKESFDSLKGSGSISTRVFIQNKGNGKGDESSLIRRLKLLGRASSFYESDLERDKRGLEYLKSRGITDIRALKDFRVGFASGGLKKILNSDEVVLSDLKALGVLNSQGKEHFDGCITVPLLDSAGQVVGMYGRRITDSEPHHLFLPGPRKGIVNGSAARDEKPVVLTEAILDAISLYSAGFRRVIPVYGTSGLTDEIILWLMRNKVREVYIVFDSDEAGKQGASWASGKLLERGIISRIIILPEKDLNEFFLKGHTLSQFEELLEKSSPAHKKTEASVVREEKLYESTLYGFKIQFGPRLYELKAISHQGTQLKCTFKVSKEGHPRFEITTIDLYSHRSRESFASSLSQAMGEEESLIQEDLMRIIEKAEGWKPSSIKEEAPEMTEAEREEAISFLKGPDLLSQISKDLEDTGYVGGETNKLLGYLVATSRLLDEPLSLIIQSRSSAGKSALLDSVLFLMPPESYLKYTRLTDQALFYRDEFSLQHKILALEESRGAAGATYSIQALQSNKYITLASTAKDPVTGRGIGYERKVRGPTTVMSTTSEPQIDGELSTRCLVTTVDESLDMTRRIHERQREAMTLGGIEARMRREEVEKRHHNAQRLLRTLTVADELAPDLIFPAHKLRSRRDQMKYLYLINSIAFLHQYQREIKKKIIAGKEVEYIEVREEDVREANLLAKEVFPCSLDDMAQGSRKLLKEIDAMARKNIAERDLPSKEYRCTRRDIREWTGWADTQIREHLRQLVELEYVIERQGRKGKEYVYELGYDPKEVKIELSDI